MRILLQQMLKQTVEFLAKFFIILCRALVRAFEMIFL